MGKWQEEARPSDSHPPSSCIITLCSSKSYQVFSSSHTHLCEQHVYVCRYVCTCMGTSMCGCMCCTWRPKVDVECLLQLLFTLLTRHGLLLNVELVVSS